MEHLILQSRQRKMLSILKMHQGIMTSTELGKQLDVSDRTVRSDIIYLNNVLASYGASIRAVRGKGYFLRLEDTTQIQTLLNTGINLQTREERARYLTLLLLASDSGYSLGDIEDIMFVSRTTLENDIRYMQQQCSLKLPFLKFIRRGNQIRCEDDERKRRILLSKLFVEDWDFHSQMGLFLREGLIEQKDFDTIFEYSIQTLSKYDVKLDDYGMMDVAFTIAIARIRVAAGHELTQAEPEFSVDTHLMNIANELIDRLEPVFHIRFNYAEREEVARTLQLRQSFAWKISTREDLEKYVNPSRIEIIESLLLEIRDLYKIDLTDDSELLICLVCHVMSVAGRVRFRYERKSSVLKTFKNEYPLVLDYALIFRAHFFASFHYEIGEDELSFIASYLLCALERRYHSRYPNGIPVAFVSHLNFSASRVFMMQLKAVFGSNIDFKGPFSIYEEETVKESGSLFMLSTVQLELCKAAIPGITISMPLDETYIAPIARALKDAKYKLFYPSLPEKISAYFERDLFFKNLQTDSRNGIIQFMADKLYAKGYVPENYAGAILQREEISSSSFDCGVAIPRVLRVSGKKTAICAATLKKPVWWGGQKVRCVFMLSIAAEDFQYLGQLLYLGVRINNDKSILPRLLAAKSFDEFVKALS